MGQARQNQQEFESPPKSTILNADHSAIIESEKQKIIGAKNRQDFQDRPVEDHIIDANKTAIIDSAERKTETPLIARTAQGSKDQDTSFDKDRR